MATRPTPPKTDHLADLQESVEDTRTAFINACVDFVDQLAPHLAPCVEALAAWRSAADTLNEALADVGADIGQFCSEHTDRWMQSDTGQAYEYWGDAMEQAQVGTDPQDNLQLTVDFTCTPPQITADNLDDLLPETPDIPELAV